MIPVNLYGKTVSYIVLLVEAPGLYTLGTLPVRATVRLSKFKFSCNDGSLIVFIFFFSVIRHSAEDTFRNLFDETASWIRLSEVRS